MRWFWIGATVYGLGVATLLLLQLAKIHQAIVSIDALLGAVS